MRFAFLTIIIVARTSNSTWLGMMMRSILLVTVLKCFLLSWMVSGHGYYLVVLVEPAPASTPPTQKRISVPVKRKWTKRTLALQKKTKNPKRSDWKYRKLNLRRYPLATCLDDSPGAYYVRPGPYKNRVLVHLQGGGWCSSLTEFRGTARNCATRAKTRLGSTLRDRNTLNMKSGIFSRAKKNNPSFHSWTHVFVRYCDGASFSGRRVEAVPGTSPPIYSRGNFILRAVIRELFLSGNRSPFSKVTRVVITGGSAGGLAAYLHAHQFREMLPDRVRLAAIPYAGFFAEWYEPLGGGGGSGNLGNSWSYGKMMEAVYNIARASESLPSGCIESQTGPENYFRCMFAANVLPYVPIPVLTIQSKFDKFQRENILGYAGQKTSSSSMTLANVNQYSKELQNTILTSTRTQVNAQSRSAIGAPLQSGVFLFSCSEHVVATITRLYTKLQIRGVPLTVAMSRWMDHVFDYAPTAAASMMVEDAAASNSSKTFTRENPLSRLTAGGVPVDVDNTTTTAAAHTVEGATESNKIETSPLESFIQEFTWVSSGRYPCKCCPKKG